MMIPDINEIDLTKEEKKETNSFSGFDPGLPYIIPMEDPETTDDLMAIDRKTKEDMRTEHKLYINSDWECNTIACTVCETLIGVLYSHIIKNGVSFLSEVADAGSLNFYDLLIVSVSYKENKSADKVGNLNIMFHPGKDIDPIVSDPDLYPNVEYMEPKARFSFPNDQDLTDAFAKIDILARREIKDNYSIIMPTAFGSIAVCYVFLRNLYQYLVLKLIKSERNSVIINFNDIIEFYAQKEEDGCKVYIRPGMGAKLIIKSDISTEESDD